MGSAWEHLPWALQATQGEGHETECETAQSMPAQGSTSCVQGANARSHGRFPEEVTIHSYHVIQALSLTKEARGLSLPAHQTAGHLWHDFSFAWCFPLIFISTWFHLIRNSGVLCSLAREESWAHLIPHWWLLSSIWRRAVFEDPESRVPQGKPPKSEFFWCPWVFMSLKIIPYFGSHELVSPLYMPCLLLQGAKQVTPTEGLFLSPPHQARLTHPLRTPACPQISSGTYGTRFLLNGDKDEK